jgi:putative DNA primase/helicase
VLHDVRRRRCAAVVHRTFLARNGRGKAPVEPTKMMLGPCRGGAVRLVPISDRLMIAEGIETALSAIQATSQAAWAALSTSGLRTLELPADVRDVVVLADGDEPGEAAARSCAWRWKREGLRVHITRPPKGMDSNHLMVGRGPRIEEAARGGRWTLSAMTMRSARPSTPFRTFTTRWTVLRKDQRRNS